ANVPSAPVDNAGNASIALHGGWNLITDPFNASLPWSAVQTANSVNSPIYAFNGSFSSSANLIPYMGYYFFNGTNLDSLKIPYSATTGGSPASTPADSVEWKIDILLSTPQLTEKSTWFGVSKSAAEGLDRFDVRKPRAEFSAASVYFDRPEWDSR